jgi:hypothetical protein
MKKLLLLCACLLALASPLRAAVAPPDLVVVRIYESIGTITAILTRGEGKSEKIEFDKGTTDKHLTASSEGYYKLFQQLYREGYTLQTSFGMARSADSGFTTLLFVKAQ